MYKKTPAKVIFTLRIYYYHVRFVISNINEKSEKEILRNGQGIADVSFT